MIDINRLDEIFKDVFFTIEEFGGEAIEENIPKDHKLGIGIKGIIPLHPERLESHKDEIIGMLKQLAYPFRIMKTSFCNGCIDIDGKQWGEQIHVDYLLTIGNALGLVEYDDRKDWHNNYGEMPLVKINI